MGRQDYQYKILYKMTHRKHVKKNKPVPCTDANQKVREHKEFVEKKLSYARKLREKYIEEYQKRANSEGKPIMRFDGAGMV